MSVDKAQSQPEESTRLDKRKHFVVVSDRGLWEVGQVREDAITAFQGPHSQLSSNKGVSKNFPTLKKGT